MQRLTRNIPTRSSEALSLFLDENDRIKESIFEKLKENFLEFLKKENYTPNTTLENMATQITSYYAACIENEPDDAYIETITSFDSIEESAEWFWKQISSTLEEYDAEI